MEAVTNPATLETESRTRHCGLRTEDQEENSRSKAFWGMTYSLGLNIRDPDVTLACPKLAV